MDFIGGISRGLLRLAMTAVLLLAVAAPALAEVGCYDAPSAAAAASVSAEPDESRRDTAGQTRACHCGHCGQGHAAAPVGHRAAADAPPAGIAFWSGPPPALDSTDARGPNRPPQG